METYSVTVNGITYEVQVEKKSAAGGFPAPVVKTAPAAPAPQPASPSPADSSGIPITAGAAGKIWKIVASEGQNVKAGDPVVILEAMKMEIPIVAPQDGVILKILASEGSPVEAGDILATMK
jgi:glutaconyl-CoA/methylmalonyl-CoA decarboxylase subunit gamma